MIHRCVGLFARLHGLKPVHQMADVIIVRPERAGRRSRSLQCCCSVAGHSWQGRLLIDWTRLPWIEFLSPTFPGGDEEGRALSTVVFDRSIPAKYARKAPVTVPKGRLVGIQKPLGIGHSRHTGVGILAAIVPDKDAPVGDHTGGMGFACPKMNHVAAVAEPLVEYPGGELLV